MINVAVKTCHKHTEGYVRHEYPIEGKFHPFDINCQLQHFLYADGYTYLTTFDKTKQISEIKKVIPKSYMPFNICERYIMIYDGNIVWKNVNVKKVEECYKVLMFHKEEIEKNHFSYELNTSGNLEEDIQSTIKKSKELYDKNIYMVVKII